MKRSNQKQFKWPFWWAIICALLVCAPAFDITPPLEAAKSKKKRVRAKSVKTKKRRIKKRPKKRIKRKRKRRRFWGKNRRHIPVESFEFSSDVARRRAWVFQYIDGYRMQTALSKMTGSRYFARNEAAENYIRRGLYSIDRMESDSAIRQVISLIQAEKKKKGKSKSAVAGSWSDFLLAELNSEQVRSNYRLFNALRAKKYLGRSSFKNVYARDPNYRGLKLSPKQNYRKREIPRLLSKNSSAIHDPKLQVFLKKRVLELNKAGIKLNRQQIEIITNEYNYDRGYYHLLPNNEIYSTAKLSKLALGYHADRPYKPSALFVGPKHGKYSSRFRKRFVAGHKYHPAANNFQFALALEHEKGGRYLDAVNSFKHIETMYDPVDGLLLSWLGWSRINYIFHHKLKRLKLLYLTKASKDLRIRFLATVTVANRFFVKGELKRAARNYEDAAGLLERLAENSNRLIPASLRKRFGFQIRKQLAKIRRSEAYFYTAHNKAATKFEKDRAHFRLADQYFAENKFFEMPMYGAKGHYLFWSQKAKDRNLDSLFFYQATGNYLAWRFYYKSSQSNSTTMKAKAIYRSSVCALRLSQKKFQFAATEYDKHYWRKLAKKGFQTLAVAGKYGSYARKAKLEMRKEKL